MQLPLTSHLVTTVSASNLVNKTDFPMKHNVTLIDAGRLTVFIPPWINPETSWNPFKKDMKFDQIEAISFHCRANSQVAKMCDKTWKRWEKIST